MLGEEQLRPDRSHGPPNDEEGGENSIESTALRIPMSRAHAVLDNVCLLFPEIANAGDRGNGEKSPFVSIDPFSLSDSTVADDFLRLLDELAQSAWGSPFLCSRNLVGHEVEDPFWALVQSRFPTSSDTGNVHFPLYALWLGRAEMAAIDAFQEDGGASSRSPVLSPEDSEALYLRVTELTRLASTDDDFGKKVNLQFQRLVSPDPEVIAGAEFSPLIVRFSRVLGADLSYLDLFKSWNDSLKVVLTSFENALESALSDEIRAPDEIHGDITRTEVVAETPLNRDGRKRRKKKKKVRQN
jgi:hypothetical protein